jgi:hypothetical protein
MPVTVYDPAGNPRAAVNVSVMPDGVTVRQAKSVKVSDGFGGWRLAWVPRVTTATLSLSKTGVVTGEQYNVVLSIPSGVPEGGVTVKFRHGTYSHTVTPAAGATSATLAGATHAAATTADWYADVTTLGGTTTFGPVRQTAYARSTATVTGPSWFMSHRCPNPSGLNYIPDVTFTISLSNYTAATRVELQIASWSDGVFKTIGIWTPGGAGGFAAIPGASWTWTFANSLFDRDGMWSARIVLTFADGATYESGHFGMDVRVKGLAAQASDYSPIVNTVVHISPSCNYGSCETMYSAAQWYHNGGAGWNPDTDAHGFDWAAWGTISWVWREVFSDGSVLHSNVITISPVAPPSEVVASDNWYGGQSGSAGLNAAMNDAVARGLPLRVTGWWGITASVWVPSNVRVSAHAAHFALSGSGRFKNAQSGGGGYSSAGGWVWDGGTFDGGGDGIWTISHCPSFTIQGTHMYAYASSSNDGHAIEVNSSGGNYTPGAYSLQIVGNRFSGVRGQRRNANDEPVQWDWAWDGSGCSAPYDHTMTHNLRIADNVFHRLNETGEWQFALCAIGSHRMSSASFGKHDTSHPLNKANPSDGNPSERHNGILIEGNEFHCDVCGSDPGSSVSPDKGIVALWSTRDAWVRNNRFYGGKCRQTYPANGFISAWDETQNVNGSPVNISISGNTWNGSPVSISLPASTTTGNS